MVKTALKLAMFLVGGHLLLGMIVLGIMATHGMNDQDPSFAVSMLFYVLNLPTALALRSGTGPAESRIILIFIVGIVQWFGLAFAISAIYHGLRSGFHSQIVKIPRRNTPPDAQSVH